MMTNSLSFLDCPQNPWYCRKPSAVLLQESKGYRARILRWFSCIFVTIYSDATSGLSLSFTGYQCHGEQLCLFPIHHYYHYCQCYTHVHQLEKKTWKAMSDLVNAGQPSFFTSWFMLVMIHHVLLIFDRIALIPPLTTNTLWIHRLGFI